MKSPTIQKFMTRLPDEVQATENLTSATNLMRERGIRHLPVFAGSKLVGILSDRDIKFAAALLGEQAKDMKISEVCSTDLYKVSPLDKVSDVAAEMAHKKMGSALVVDGDTLVGLFTTSDALRALSEAYSS
ncbi:MAG: CBS domain-containing protein [Bdellovibrionales bacterium]|nr:CBS domain-containing protein [Bdellovibrionales bacterium]